MELTDTINLMASENYKDRFRSEYLQTKIRREKLNNLLERYDEGKLEFTPTCPIKLLEAQREVMGAYLDILIARALLEGVSIE